MPPHSPVQARTPPLAVRPGSPSPAPPTTPEGPGFNRAIKSRAAGPFRAAAGRSGGAAATTELPSRVRRLKPPDKKGATVCGLAEARPFRMSLHGRRTARLKPGPSVLALSFNTLRDMAHPPRTANAGNFFLTAITYNRRRLFQNEANAKLFIETLQHYRAEGFYMLYAFVVMPDHVHLLITTADLATAMQRIKGGFSRKLNLASKFPVWQRGYTDHLVLNREQFDSRREYIHQNPVRERLVERAEHYAFSSAHRPVKAATPYES